MNIDDPLKRPLQILDVYAWDSDGMSHVVLKARSKTADTLCGICDMPVREFWTGIKQCVTCVTCRKRYETSSQ